MFDITRACERAARSHGCVGCAFVVFVWRRRRARGHAAAARALRLFVARSATAVRARSATRLPLGRLVACSTAVRPFARGRAAHKGGTARRRSMCVRSCAVGRKTRQARGPRRRAPGTLLRTVAASFERGRCRTGKPSRQPVQPLVASKIAYGRHRNAQLNQWAAGTLFDARRPGSWQANIGLERVLRLQTRLIGRRVGLRQRQRLRLGFWMAAPACPARQTSTQPLAQRQKRRLIARIRAPAHAVATVRQRQRLRTCPQHR